MITVRGLGLRISLPSLVVLGGSVIVGLRGDKRAPLRATHVHVLSGHLAEVMASCGPLFSPQPDAIAHGRQRVVIRCASMSSTPTLRPAGMTSSHLTREAKG